MQRLRRALSMLRKGTALVGGGTPTVNGRICWMVTGGVVLLPAAALFVDPSVPRQTVTQVTSLAQLYIAWKGKKKAEFDHVPKETQVTNDELVSALQDAMLHPMCGIHIVCAPRDTGKSYAARLAGNRLLDTEQITGFAMVETTEAVRTRKTLSEWLKIELGVSPFSGRAISTLFAPHKENSSERFVIVLDQFDAAEHNPAMRSFLELLATNSANAKNYTVMILISDVALYSRLLSVNDGAKVRPVTFSRCTDSKFPLWTENMLKTMTQEQVEYHGYGLDEKQIDDFASVAATVGTPGFVLSELPAYAESPRPEKHLKMVKINSAHRLWVHQWPSLYPSTTAF